MNLKHLVYRVFGWEEKKEVEPREFFFMIPLKPKVLYSSPSYSTLKEKSFGGTKMKAMNTKEEIKKLMGTMTPEQKEVMTKFITGEQDALKAGNGTVGEVLQSVYKKCGEVLTPAAVEIDVLGELGLDVEAEKPCESHSKAINSRSEKAEKGVAIIKLSLAEAANLGLEPDYDVDCNNCIKERLMKKYYFEKGK